MNKFVVVTQSMALTASLLGLIACSGDGNDNTTSGVDNVVTDPNVVSVAAGDGFQTRLMEALIKAQPGNIIELPAGEYPLNTSISLDVDNVTLRGKGEGSTVLNFASQSSGGESVLVTSNNVVLEDFAVVDPPSDGIKFKFSNGVTMRRMRVQWTCGACEENGAYGLYPVQTENVLIEDSVVIGASDAGVYVGQSDKIIVRRNRVSLNVAGIEIENSTNSEVYDNTAVDNTGGILVFDLPNLSREGTRVRVYDNVVRGNNTVNFAPEGNIVGVVPTGTGMLVMVFSDVEIFNNTIEDNQSAAVVIVDYDIRLLGGIADRVDRASHTVEQLLTLARLDPESPLERVPVPLRALLVEVLADTGHLARANNLSVEFADGPEIMMNGNMEALAILLRNLLVNAFRYATQSTTVHINLKQADAVQLQICNACAPLSPDEFRQISHRFYRVPGTAPTGAGLGLSIVERIATLHNAKFSAGPWRGGDGFCALLVLPRFG